MRLKRCKNFIGVGLFLFIFVPNKGFCQQKDFPINQVECNCAIEIGCIKNNEIAHFFRITAQGPRVSCKQYLKWEFEDIISKSSYCDSYDFDEKKITIDDESCHAVDTVLLTPENGQGEILQYLLTQIKELRTDDGSPYTYFNLLNLTQRLEKQIDIININEYKVSPDIGELAKKVSMEICVNRKYDMGNVSKKIIYRQVKRISKGLYLLQKNAHIRMPINCNIQGPLN